MSLVFIFPCSCVVFMFSLSSPYFCRAVTADLAGYTRECTQWCRFLSQEVREISRIFVAPPTRVRPRPPRDISRAKFKFLLINLHH